MANNGYLIGNLCSSQLEYVVYIASLDSRCIASSYVSLLYSTGLYACQNSNGWYPLTGLSAANCEIPGPGVNNGIPTVQDGVTLGWQAGGSLILVACLLFIRKAFLK